MADLVSDHSGQYSASYENVYTFSENKGLPTAGTSLQLVFSFLTLRLSSVTAWLLSGRQN